MFKKLVCSLGLALFLLSLFLIGCSDQHQKRMLRFKKWVEPNGKLKVLSTTGMIDDLVRRIGQDHIDTIVLIEGELDPHSYQLVKGDDEKLAHADIIFYNGLGLEHGPSLHSYLANHRQAIPLGDQLDKQFKNQVIYVNGQKDPHIWMDISLWSKTVPILVQTLSSSDPTHVKEYEKNGLVLLEEMANTDRLVKETMHKVPQESRFLVTSHDAFNYFARAYLSEPGEVESGDWVKRFTAPEGLAPESQLSVTHIKEIIEHLKKYQIKQIFPESNVSRDSIRKIVNAGKEQGLDVQIACCALYGDAMGPEGSEGDSYLKMLLYNAKILSENMK